MYVGPVSNIMYKVSSTGEDRGDRLLWSSLIYHVLEENHSVDWSKATVIEVQSKCLQRRLLESWHIGKECS